MRQREADLAKDLLPTREVLRDTEVSKECMRYMGGEDICAYPPRIASCEQRLLMPPEMALTMDPMHAVKNVLQCLLGFICGGKRKKKGKKSKDTKDALQAILKEYFKGVHRTDPEFNISSLPKWVKQKAKKRLEHIRHKPGFDWISPQMVEPGVFKGVKTHDCLVFGFSLFSYTFQDSMCIPAVFAAVKIMECLSWMYNFDGATDELQRVQYYLDFFCALFEGEVEPRAVSVTLHELIHFSHSIQCSGPPASNNNFNQESHYKEVKRSVQKGAAPEVTAQNRIKMCTYTGMQRLSCIKDPTLSWKPGEEENPEREAVLRGYIDPARYKLLCEMNPLDDASFYRDDSVPRYTALDAMVENLSSGSDAINEALQQYAEKMRGKAKVLLGRSTSDAGDGTHDQDQLRIYKSIDGMVDCSSSLSTDLGAINVKDIEPHIAYSRMYNGTVAAFLVVGYTCTEVNGVPYYQALCVHVPTETTSSFLETQHCAFVCVDNFLRSMGSPIVFPVSVHRLIMNRCLCLKYGVKETRCGLSYLKLAIRQCHPIPASLALDYVEKGEYYNKHDTRHHT